MWRTVRKSHSSSEHEGGPGREAVHDDGAKENIIPAQAATGNTTTEKGAMVRELGHTALAGAAMMRRPTGVLTCNNGC